MDHETAGISEIKVGVFVIGALAILIIGALWITGSQIFSGRQIDYWVLMKNADEIEVGDRVRMAGVTIGRVNEIRLRPNEEWPVAFRVVLGDAIPIKTDSTARIVSSGLLGDGTLQIEAGSPDAPLVKQGGEILGQTMPDLQEILATIEAVSTQAASGMERMTVFMNEVSQEARPLLKNINTLLSEENTRRVRRILLNLDTTLDQAGPHFSSFSARLDTVSRRLEDTLEKAPMTMKSFSEFGNDFRSAIGPEGARLSELIDRAEDTLTSAQRSLSVIDDNREKLGAIMNDLQAGASNLKTFSQQIKERPFSLIRSASEPDRQPGQGLKERKR